MHQQKKVGPMLLRADVLRLALVVTGIEGDEGSAHASSLPFRLEAMLTQESENVRAGTSLSRVTISWLAILSASQSTNAGSSAMRANRARSIVSSWLILDVSGAGVRGVGGHHNPLRQPLKWCIPAGLAGVAPADFEKGMGKITNPPRPNGRARD